MSQFLTFVDDDPKIQEIMSKILLLAEDKGSGDAETVGGEIGKARRT